MFLLILIPALAGATPKTERPHDRPIVYPEAGAPADDHTDVVQDANVCPESRANPCMPTSAA